VWLNIVANGACLTMSRNQNVRRGEDWKRKRVLISSVSKQKGSYRLWTEPQFTQRERFGTFRMRHLVLCRYAACMTPSLSLFVSGEKGGLVD
jgi:hypothetical protein